MLDTTLRRVHDVLMPENLTFKDAALALGVSRPTLYRMVDEGVIAYTTIPLPSMLGTRRVIPVSEVERILALRAQSA